MSDQEFQFYFPPSPPAPPPSPGGAQPPATARRTSGGFGAGPFGAMAFGSGGGVSIADVEQITRNALRVRFSGPIPIDNPGDVADALYDRGYALAVYNQPLGFVGTPHVPRVICVERESASSVIVYLDATLDGPGVVYRLIASSPAFGAVPESSRSAVFHTFGEGRVPRPQTLRTYGGDLANVQSDGPNPGDPISLGTMQTDADGDYKNDQGLDNLKKRVIRRVTTRKGRYKHAPLYGLAVPEKGLVTPSRLRELQADALEQLSQEPGVLTAIVTVQLPDPGVVVLGLDVTAIGGAVFGLDVHLPIVGRS